MPGDESPGYTTEALRAGVTPAPAPAPAPDNRCDFAIDIDIAIVEDSKCKAWWIGPPREFSVRCTYEGTCDETYILMGRFTTDDRWQGEFRASFSGICYDCSAQIWAVVGTR